MPEESAANVSVRVVVMTTDERGIPHSRAVAARVPIGETIEIGREGDLPIANDPEDLGVSRVAVRLRAVPGRSMDLTVTNRNGVAVHPWGSRPRYLDPGDDVHLVSGLSGIRIIGSAGSQVHWVLVEGAHARRPQVPLQRTASTVANQKPADLTDAQRDAVVRVFADHLAWPPHPTPVTATLDSVARKLGVSPTGLTERLSGVRKKATALGMPHQLGVADPEYVHVLVAHGYLDPPQEALPADELELFDLA